MKKYWLPIVLTILGLIVFYVPNFDFANAVIPGAHVTIFPQNLGVILICLGIFTFFLLRVFRRFFKKTE